MDTGEYLAQLGRAHGFTLDELRANLAGEIHPAQLARGQRRGTLAVVVFALLGTIAFVGGVGGALAFRDSLGPDASSVDMNAVYLIGGLGLLLAGACDFAVIRTLKRQRARRAAYASGRVEVLEGPVNKVSIRGRNAQCWIEVQGRRFYTSRKLHDLLTQGAIYRLHLVDGDLLSLAPARGDAAEQAAEDLELAELTRLIEKGP